MKTLFMIIFILILSACSRDRAALEREVALSLNKALIESPKYSRFNLKVEGVSLSKKERNYYIGTVEVIFNSDIYRISIRVVTDNEQLLWEVDSDALLFLIS